MCFVILINLCQRLGWSKRGSHISNLKPITGGPRISEVVGQQLLIFLIFFYYDYRTIESLFELKETLVEIEEKIADVEYDELIMSEDFNSDPNKGWFFKEFKCFIDAF